MNYPETLEQLYPRNTPLSEVHPDFRGMPLTLWRKLKITEQAEAYLAKLNSAEAPLAKQRIATARDNYGMKGW